MPFLLFALLFFIAHENTYAQNIFVSRTFPQHDFRMPLDLPPSLSGSFGEIRSNHFHSGIDFRTNQREGYPVYAAADGYISRLRVQNGGFGNAVYIAHPNGYTTVYAHLQRFNTKLLRHVRSYQYRQQSFDVDFPLLPIEIPVKKGEIIAWSGNTGSSGGPHLHFEVRDSRTEETLNPELFGIDVPDKVKPVINGMYMYRLNGRPFDENTPRQYFQVTGSNGKYRLNQSPVIHINGETGFGIMTYDQQFVSGNHNGVYSIELLLDDESVYCAVLEGFYFHHSRAVNSHLDYPALILHGRRIQKSFVEPGNPLTIYKNLINRGIIDLKDDRVHRLKYIVMDTKGNVSTLEFQVKYDPSSVIARPKTEGIQDFYYDRQNEYSTADVKITIPEGSLYSSIAFNYSESAKPARGYSKIHHVHTRLIPLHSGFNLSIRPDSTLRPDLQEKALIVDSRGISQGGTFENGFVKASPRSFGSFYVSVDTIAPAIRPVNVSDGKSFKNIDRMLFKISDNLSGIRSFTGTINGQWVLMEYDPKTASLWHTFDERTPPGKHLFQLVVTDMKSNTKTYTAAIYR